jgi:hypothetical protein
MASPVMVATVRGQRYEIPEIWVMGWCHGARLRHEPSSIADAVAFWAWQAELERAELEVAT